MQHCKQSFKCGIASKAEKPHLPDWECWICLTPSSSFSLASLIPDFSCQSFQLRTEDNAITYFWEMAVHRRNTWPLAYRLKSSSWAFCDSATIFVIPRTSRRVFERWSVYFTDCLRTLNWREAITEDMGAIRTNRANPVNEAGPSYN